jgi:N-methylhydantoinase B/acetone carboxylase, alpha subunit
VEQNLADLAAQVAANETGRRELARMVDHFGLATVQAYMGQSRTTPKPRCGGCSPG